jgi:DnaK suppressor protein
MTELTAEQRNEFQQQLLAMRRALEARSESAAQDREPVSLDQPIGRLTRMDAIQQQQMALGQQQRVEQELRQIEAALRRLEDQRYGSCLRCHEAIPYARLKIRPTTTLCYDCQCESERHIKKR